MINRSRRGFTLVEIMLVLILISIVSGLVLTNFGPVYRHQVLLKYGREFETLSQVGTMRAQATGYYHRIAVDGLTDSFWLESRRHESNAEFERVGIPFNHVYVLPSGFWMEVAAERSDGGVDYIYFYPDGTRDSATAILHASSGKKIEIVFAYSSDKSSPL